jgi:hypothetical protein
MTGKPHADEPGDALKRVKFQMVIDDWESFIPVVGAGADSEIELPKPPDYDQHFTELLGDIYSKFGAQAVLSNVPMHS